ncbi:MAG: hypothetical protein U9N59_02105 [Campylobacterota bacterium]|nr:hypothetical protein [Campylobacterota bacterium]
MKALIALEELVKEGEARIKLIKKQLSEHESGENKLSKMVLASTESAQEEVSENLEKHREKLAEFKKQDLQELEKSEKIKEAIKRKNYYDFQKTRLKRDITRSNDEKIEAMLIIDELPQEIDLEDKELFDVAARSLKLNLSLHENLHEKLSEIKKEFDDLIKDLKDDDIKDMQMLNYQIPIIILQFSTLIENIKENRKEEELPEFRGLPKFEDWWITELWQSHQAYLGLYKWKEIISHICISTDQKKAWEVISSNWISIKKTISNKGMLAFKYNYAFDTVMRTHCGLEEELATTSLDTMKKLMAKLTQKEDFTKNSLNHAIITPYVLFKRKQLDYKDIKGKK